MLVSAVRTVSRFLWDLVYFVTGEGSWALRPHEQIVLEAAVSGLPEAMQILLRSQMTQPVFVQRSHRQISRPRFYSHVYARNQETTEDPRDSHKVMNVDISVGGEKQRAHVEFFRGRVDSIQFKKSGKFYVGKEVKVVAVKPGKPGITHAAAIDRREHGTHPLGED